MFEEPVQDVDDDLEALNLYVAYCALRNFLDVKLEVVYLELNGEVLGDFELSSEIDFVADYCENLCEFIGFAISSTEEIHSELRGERYALLLAER
jgi:hypothetical protein